MTEIDQFLVDLDDWCQRRGDNIVASEAMVRRCATWRFGYWQKWLGEIRVADGLTLHAVPVYDSPPQPPKEVA